MLMVKETKGVCTGKQNMHTFKPGRVAILVQHLPVLLNGATTNVPDIASTVTYFDLLATFAAQPKTST